MRPRHLQFRFAAPFLALTLAFAVWVVGEPRAQPIETSARHAYLIDLSTQTVLFEKQSDVAMPPASMSKLMTLLMVFERLQRGELSLTDTFPVSEKAWRKGGSKMFVEVGKRVAVADLLRGIIVQSGNDACIVFAEGLSGSELAFADEMTARARELGLQNSRFRNSTGWPDPDHVMSARDLARLAEIIITDYPEFYPYFLETTYTYNEITQSNRNPLLYSDIGADGLKTGHTQEAGYGLTASAIRGDRRLILVLNGLPSVGERKREAERLLEWGFRAFTSTTLFQSGEVVEEATVWMGEHPTVPMVLDGELSLTLPTAAHRGMKVVARYDGPIAAPIAIGSPIGELTVSVPGMEPIVRKLHAGARVEELGLVGKMAFRLRSLVSSISP